MEAAAHPAQVEWGVFGIRFAATLFFVALNGFFVAAEFALVKVRATQLRSLADEGVRSARVATHIYAHMDRYLSACQLGITLASLILGWLAEPAIAELLIALAPSVGLEFAPNDPIVHTVALALALTVVTVLHMTIGEQAPKIWAIERSQITTLWCAYPLRWFEICFRPFIWVINTISNWLLRMVGLTRHELHEGSHSVEELRHILDASAKAGHISDRQLELAENVFGIIGLEVRHILVPRVDVVFLSLQSPLEENLRVIRESGHSRFPLCSVGLDTVVGVIHAKDIMYALAEGREVDLERIARKPLFVSDTQPLSRLIVRMQRARSHCSVVLDERGTAVGLAFLEDAVEEIVGPIRDEFDDAEVPVQSEGGAVLVPGSLALPEAEDLLDLGEIREEADTIGGHVVAVLGRLPRQGDELEIGPYRVTITGVARRRITELRFEPLAASPKL